MIIRFSEDEAKTLVQVARKRVERIAYPGKYRIFWDTESKDLILELYEINTTEGD